MAGFLVLWGGDKYLISADESAPADDHARTAIVMPIYEEDVSRTFAGLARHLRVAGSDRAARTNSISSC